MAPPLLLLAVAVCLLSTATTTEGAARTPPDDGCHISRDSCVAVCKYPTSPLVKLCGQCYPSICEGVARASSRRVPATLSRRQHAAALLMPQARNVDYTNDPGCTDPRTGLHYKVFSTWFDDDVYPCFVYTCQPNGHIETTALGNACDPPPTHLGNCTRHRDPGQCCYNYTCNIPHDPQLQHCLVDGEVRQHGETWQDDPLHPCVTYACNNGDVAIIQNMQPLCPLPPQDGCVRYREPFQCCYSYNCTVIVGLQHCLDTQSNPPVLRTHLEIWTDDDDYTCVKYLCNNGTINTILDLRSTCDPEPSQPGCTADRKLGDCCYTYTCGCIHNGNHYAEGAEFQDDPVHPCRLLRCVSGTVVTVAQTTCPPLPCTNVVWPAGQCCRECAPCVFNDVEYVNGQTWFDDPQRPCVQYICDNGQARVIQNVTCDPAPHPSCTEWYMENVCCPKWDCVDAPCVVDGVSHDHGTTWPEDPLRPCRHLYCNNSVVSVASQHRPCPPPPADHCRPRYIDYQCCPAYDCVTIQCTYNGVNYTEGQTWVDDPSFPCKRWRCTREGPLKILDLQESCPPLVPPDCPNERKLGQCCKQCIIINDPVCVDSNGVEKPVNSTYFEDPITKCRYVRCVANNVTTVVYDRTENCGPDLTLSNPQCSVVGAKDCCPIYQCPNCTYNGVVYPPDSKWWDNDARQCTRYMCMKDGQQTIIFTRLPCPEVPAGCVPNYQNKECCHFKYTCMYDPQHNLIPMP